MVSAGPKGKRGRSGSRRVSVFGVAGELLVTFGLLALLFVGWEFWWTGVQAGAVQSKAVEQFVREARPSMPLPAVPGAASGPEAVAGPADFGLPPVADAPAPGETFGVIYIPRFGAEYSRPLAEGTGMDVLDTLGLGRYPSTTMPGAPGNFAVAGHRQTHGAVLDNIHTLVPGDKLYVQTADGFYTYVFRNTEIVLPERTDVLLPVPTDPGASPQESLLTLTSCNPRFGQQERIIAYSVLDSWQPLSAGPPAEIASQLAALQEEG
ncbi:class E sortase [Arthrobacter sp. H41]|uniref:class E sortase n=1 Tax=Arthrobacter sp. H41 TaxID=1312978 RepID=UPI000676319B|nr:class E sortase [Arthrobacter sp. H41]